MAEMKYDIRRGMLSIQGISRNELDLSKTFDCGQCFRWNRVGQNTWCGIVNDIKYFFKQEFINDENIIATSATLAEWERFFINYFNLDVDYSEKYIIPEGDTFGKDAERIGKGIRILRQDPWETLVSFIISQQNNIPKIKSTIEKLVYGAGNPINMKINGGDKSGKRFPTPDNILSTPTSTLQQAGLGYRVPYIIAAAEAIKLKTVDLKALYDDNVSTKEAIDELMQIKGVGPKVANCVALFGLHKMDSFPMDVWMKRVANRHYNGNIDPTVYGEYAGLVQQYMFYAIR